MIYFLFCCLSFFLPFFIEKDESKTISAQSLQIEQVNVKTVKSLIEPSTIDEVIKKNYSLGEIIHSQILSTGINDMYLIKVEEQKYVLRLSRVEKYWTMTSKEFIFELEWLVFLKEQHIPVSYPIRRSNGQLCGLIQAPEGPRYFTLFSFASGTTAMDCEQAFILGRSLAQLHQASYDFKTSCERLHLDVEELISSPLQQIKNYFGSEFHQKYSFLEKLAADLIKKIEAMPRSSHSYGVVAGDLHGYNQHFTQDNKLTMFDFEFCAYGDFIYDLATFKWSRGSESPELWEAFLSGYQSIRILEDFEVQEIDTFVNARTFWWIGGMLSLPEIKHELDEQFWKRAFKRFKI